MGREIERERERMREMGIEIEEIGSNPKSDGSGWIYLRPEPGAGRASGDFRG